MAAPWSSTGLLTGNKSEQIGSSSTYALRGKMTSSSPTETATTYTIPSVKLSTVLSKTSSESFTLTAQSISSVYVGVSIGGTTKLEYDGTSITGTKSGSISITKTHQSQSVTLSLRFNYVGQIVVSSSSGGFYDSYGNTGEPVYGTYTFTVPAKTHYTVSFNANSGSGAPSAQTKWHGETLTLSSTKPTRTGYTFLGWSTSSTATSATYAAGGSYTANAAAVLYAVWRINTWTVAYNANGGTGAPASQTKTYGQTLTLSSSRPARSGYAFLGWATKSDGTGTAYAPGGSYTANAAATLYAVWVAVQVTSLSAYRSTSSGTRSDSGTYGRLSAGWKALGTIAGTVAVTATANDADVTSSLSNRSGSKTATDDLSNTSVGTFGGSYAQDVAVRVSVTATLTVSYGGSNRSVSATRVATIPKVFRLLDALHGGTGLAIGTIATLANTFEVALQTVFQNVVEVVQSNITRDGTYTEPTNGDHQIRLVDSSRRILSYLSAHKAANSPNNYLRLTAYGPSGSKTANVYICASDTDGFISTDCDLGTSLKQSASGRGYFLKDSAGNDYPGVYDNGSNLWLGATMTASTHHVGATYISSGYSGTNGHTTIYICVPNATNDGGTNYGVYHTGYKPTPADIGAASTTASGYINVDTFAQSNRALMVGGTVNNSSSSVNGHRVSLYIETNQLGFYDNTAGANIWSFGTTVTSTNVGTDIATASTGFTIDSGGSHRAFKRNGVCTVYLTFKSTNALTAGTTYTVGTLNSEWRPYALAVLGIANTRYNYNAYTQSNGTIRIVPSQAVSANATFVVGGTFVQA